MTLSGADITTLLSEHGLRPSQALGQNFVADPNTVRRIARNQVLLDMVVGSQSPEPVITFLKQLQTSPRFGPATVHNSAPPTDNEPLYRYRVSVNYAQKL